MTKSFQISKLKSKYHKAAIMIADWMVANQVKDQGSADFGRFIGSYNKNQQNLNLTGNWSTGVTVMALLMMWRRTGIRKYLSSAIAGGEYLKILQILDVRNPSQFGCLHEVTPQDSAAHPRDALTGALGLLWLHDETRQKEYLFRAKIFAEWFTNVAMKQGWPAWTIFFDKTKVWYLEGSFHGGSGVFFYDYYRITKDDCFLKQGLRFIADYMIKRFLDESGRIRVIYDPEKVKYLDGIERKWCPLDWQRMHKYNDDFSAITLFDAYRFYRDEKYLKRVCAFANWLINQQQPEGGYGKPMVHSASATVPILMLDLYKLIDDKRYLESSFMSGQHLLSLQETKFKDKRLLGAFYETSDRTEVNIRTTAYALIALLKLEGVVRGPYYSCFE